MEASVLRPSMYMYGKQLVGRGEASAAGSICVEDPGFAWVAFLSRLRSDHSSLQAAPASEASQDWRASKR